MTQLNKSISLLQGVGLLSMTMLGTGVFIIPQLTVDVAGGVALWAWICVVLAVIPLAWIFAQLGKRYPDAGGVAHIVGLAFGRQHGTVVGLMFLLLVPVGAPAAIEITLAFLHALIPFSASIKPVIAVVLIMGIFFLNRRGLQLSGSFQTVLTLSMVMLVLALLASQIQQLIFAADVDNMGIAPVVTGIPSFEVMDVGTLGIIASAAGLALWSFLGIEAMNHLSEEFKNPERDFAPAMLIGVLLVGVLYIICTWLLWNHSENNVSENIDHLRMITVFDSSFGSGGRWVIGLLGVMSSIATVNIYIVSVSRLGYSLAQKGVLPSYLVKLNRFQVPERSLISLCLLIIAVLLLAQVFSIHYESLIRWTNGVCVLVYLVSVISAWKLLSASHRPMIVMGVVACLFFAFSLGVHMLYGAFLWLVVTVAIFTRKKWGQAASLS